MKRFKRSKRKPIITKETGKNSAQFQTQNGKSEETILVQNDSIVNPPSAIQSETSKKNSSEMSEIRKYVVSGAALLQNKTETIPYLVEPLFIQSGLVAIIGSSDTGKSSFLRQLATAIVHDDPDFLGLRITSRYKRVLYVSTEDDSMMMGHLIAKQNVNNKPDNTYGNLGFIFNSDDIVKKVEKAIKNLPCDCVIIDAFPDIYSGDMNQTNKVRSFLANFSNLAEKYKCLFIFLHHTSKRTEDLVPSKNNAIGSQGFEAKMRMVIELRKDFSDPIVRHMCIVKGNYLPEEFKDSSYVLKFENMRFTNLNRRVPFDQLGKPEVKPNIQKEKAIEYKIQGRSVNQIVDLLIADGFDAKRSTVAKWISNVESAPVLYGYEDDEPDLAEDSEEEPIE